MRRAIVTGANAGVGRYTALGLAKQSFHVILACRSTARGEEAAEWIRSLEPAASVETMALDLANFNSVLDFAGRIEEQGPLHVLVLNAGIGGMGLVPEATAEGADLLYKVNFVSQFLLLLKLEASLRQGAAARVVCLSSVMHRFGDATDWHPPIFYSPARNTYGTSKLAMAVLASEISRRWGAYGISGVAVNPGAVNSDIWYRGTLASWQESIVRPLFRAVFLTSQQGSACSVAAATEARFEAPTVGVYLCPYRTPRSRPMPFELHGPFAGPRLCQPHPATLDEGAGKSLWEVTSEHLSSNSMLSRAF